MLLAASLFIFVGCLSWVVVLYVTQVPVPTLPPLDQGWATLIAGVIGLGTIALQTRSGFRNLREGNAAQARLNRQSQERQAEHDRRAREEQFQIQQRAQIASDIREKRIVSAALNAELLILHTQLTGLKSWLLAQRAMFRAIPRDQKLPLVIPGLSTPIYDAHIEKLGTLDPSLVSDVSEIFGKAKLPLNFSAVQAEVAIPTIDAVLQAWDDLSRDFQHVQKRLLAAQAGKEDPGALFQDRIGRKKSVVDVSADDLSAGD